MMKSEVVPSVLPGEVSDVCQRHGDGIELRGCQRYRPAGVTAAARSRCATIRCVLCDSQVNIDDVSDRFIALGLRANGCQDSRRRRRRWRRCFFGVLATRLYRDLISVVACGEGGVIKMREIFKWERYRMRVSWYIGIRIVTVAQETDKRTVKRACFVKAVTSPGSCCRFPRYYWCSRANIAFDHGEPGLDACSRPDRI